MKLIAYLIPEPSRLSRPFWVTEVIRIPFVKFAPASGPAETAKSPRLLSGELVSLSIPLPRTRKSLIESDSDRVTDAVVLPASFWTTVTLPAEIAWLGGVPCTKGKVVSNRARTPASAFTRKRGAWVMNWSDFVFIQLGLGRRF